MKAKRPCRHEQEIIRALNTIIQLIDPYERDHGKQVARYAVRLAKALKLPQATIKKIHLGALLHDIGKVGIPLTIIRKKGPLTKHEYNLMKKHPENSALILSKFGTLKKLIHMVRHHHEHFDGSGYPDGLVGKKIPIEARILSIADVYDAITSTRYYHHAHGGKYAIAYILENTPQQFDPELVKTFVRIEKTFAKTTK